MFKNISIGFCLLSFVYLKAQDQPQYPQQKHLDSLSQKHWQKLIPNLDSLDNPVLAPIALQKINLINQSSKKEINFEQIDEELPLTPLAFQQISKERLWYLFGKNNLSVNQASFSHWNAGGVNNISANAKLQYTLSYRNRRHYLENILNMAYGTQIANGLMRKTDDYLQIQSNYGYKINQDWSFSSGLDFNTQFVNGFHQEKLDKEGTREKLSGFMAPAYLNIGTGWAYNPQEDLQIILRPFNAKFTFVLDEDLQKKGLFGLDKNGQIIRHELGGYVNIIFRQEFFTDAFFSTQMSFFSNYLNNPQRVDIQSRSELNLRFNKFISTILSLDLYYDDDQIKKVQLKQLLGIGFVYQFGNTPAKNFEASKFIRPF